MLHYINNRHFSTIYSIVSVIVAAFACIGPSYALGSPDIAPSLIIPQTVFTSLNTYKTASYNVGMDPAYLGQSCLVLESARNYLNDKSFDVAIKEIADILVETIDTNNNGLKGWPYWELSVGPHSCDGPGTLDAFGDSSCNPKGTEYEFQTSFAIMCLARASIILNKPIYNRAAIEAADSSYQFGTSFAECPYCYFTWYSYHPNDYGRFVRNTNALMGAAYAWVWKATQRPKYRTWAMSVAASEDKEIKAGNWGYFGIHDIKYQENPSVESGRIENHTIFISKGLLDISRLTNTSLSYGGRAPISSKTVFDDSIAVQNSWQYCSSNFCSKQTCKTYAADFSRCQESATFAPCFFKKANDNYFNICQSILSNTPRKSFTALQLWAIFDQ